MERTTVAQAGIAVAVEALRRAYAGYFVPLHFSEDAFARYLRANDIDAAASPLWLHEGEPAAIGVAGIRAERGWIGAFGLAPGFRGKGLAHAMFGDLLRHIKRQSVRSIALEVLDRNVAAIAVYERAGFQNARKLFTLQSPTIVADAEGAETIDPTAAIALDDRAGAVPCWQRENRSLELRLAALRAVRSGNSFAVFRAESGEVSLLKARVEPDDADALLGAVAAHSADGTVAVVNEPEGSALLPLLRSRDWSVVHVQNEMRRSA